MKSPLTPFKAELEQATTKARERIAAALFSETAVKERMLKAAESGFTACLFAQDQPVDLRTTDAAKKVISWAGKTGLHCEWQQRIYVDKDGVSSGAVYELLIRWDDGRLEKK